MENSEKYRTELKICIIGAGFSGICAGVKLKTDWNIQNFTIFDSNSEVGGTWLTNTYPGCACDTPSHLYSYSFELNPDWTTQYAKQPEILTYLKNVASKHNLYAHMKFNSHIRTASWDANVGKWIVGFYETDTQNTVEEFFDIVISGVGTLREPNIPEQFLGFKGPVMHSARWDSSIDLKNKIVAVIGSGCSAVQIVPEISKNVKRILSFQRHPAWVIPLFSCQFSERTKKAFAILPGFQRLYRAMHFISAEMAFPALKANGFLPNVASWIARRHLRKQIPGDPELRKSLTPDYRFGCRRTSLSSNYYTSLAVSHSQIIRDSIVSVKEDSIVTADETEYKIDVLVLATGYKVQDFWSPLEIRGHKSENILELWKEFGPSHYLGIMTSTAPNIFFLNGPNSAFGHNTVIVSIECQMNWISQVIGEMIRCKSHVVSVKKATEEKYMKFLTEKMKGTVWGAYDCGSWYSNKQGSVTYLYPGSVISYWNKTRKLKCSKLEFS